MHPHPTFSQWEKGLLHALQDAMWRQTQRFLPLPVGED